MLSHLLKLLPLIHNFEYDKLPALIMAILDSASPQNYRHYLEKAKITIFGDNFLSYLTSKNIDQMLFRSFLSTTKTRIPILNRIQRYISVIVADPYGVKTMTSLLLAVSKKERIFLSAPIYADFPALSVLDGTKDLLIMLCETGNESNRNQIFNDFITIPD